MYQPVLLPILSLHAAFPEQECTRKREKAQKRLNLSKKIKNFSKQILEDEDLLWQTYGMVIARFTSQDVSRSKEEAEKKEENNVPIHDWSGSDDKSVDHFFYRAHYHRRYEQSP